MLMCMLVLASEFLSNIVSGPLRATHERLWKWYRQLMEIGCWCFHRTCTSEPFKYWAPKWTLWNSDLFAARPRAMMGPPISHALVFLKVSEGSCYTNKELQNELEPMVVWLFQEVGKLQILCLLKYHLPDLRLETCNFARWRHEPLSKYWMTDTFT